MKTLILAISMLALTGCGSAQLVSTRYKPTKAATVRLDWQGPVNRASAETRAKELMVRFCAPQKPSIVGTDTETKVSGVYAQPYANGAAYGYDSSPLIHFECI